MHALSVARLDAVAVEDAQGAILAGRSGGRRRGIRQAGHAPVHAKPLAALRNADASILAGKV
jgi:hypothetical protein